MKKPAKLSLAQRFSLVQAVGIFVVMGLFTFALSSLITRRIEQRTENELTQQVLLLANSMSTFHTALADSAGKLAAIFRADFPGSFSLDQGKTVTIGDKQTPLLKSGATIFNNNSDKRWEQKGHV